MGTLLNIIGAIILAVLISLLFAIGVGFINEHIYGLQPFIAPVYP